MTRVLHVQKVTSVHGSETHLLSLLPPELRFERDDPQSLVARLEGLAALPREELGRSLRERVAAEHSVGSWADAIVRAAGLA